MDLIPRASFPNKAPHRLTPPKNEDLNRQVNKFLGKDLISGCFCPCVVPVVLAPKKNREWIMCTNSRAINKITLKYRYSFPMMDDIMDCLSHGKNYFTNIDLKSGYHHIIIREGDEWKISFKINEGIYEWLVMPLGLTNAPSTFMRLMNEVFKKFLGKFVIVYLGDILIFSKTRE